MMRSCIAGPTYLCSAAFISRHAASSACSSCSPIRRSRFVSSLALMLTPNRWNGVVRQDGGSWKRPQLIAARSVPSARLTVAISWPWRYAALKRRISLGFSSAVTGRSPSDRFTALSRPLIVTAICEGPPPRRSSCSTGRGTPRRSGPPRPRLCRGGTCGSRPATISPRNFGSQTRSAVCFDVIGSVAPRASAKSSTGMRHRLPSCITSNHQGCSHRGLARHPFCLQIFRTAIRPPFGYETLVGAPRRIQSRTSAG